MSDFNTSPVEAEKGKTHTQKKRNAEAPRATASNMARVAMARRTLQRLQARHIGTALSKTTRVAAGACLHRSFSSSSSDGDTTPQFERGLSGVYSVFERVMDRSDELQRYQQSHVFAPDDSALTSMLAFVTLNIPQRTQINVVEFIEGARHACKQQLSAINSLEFGRYMGGEIPERESESAQRLKSYCTPGYYTSASANVKLTYAMRNLIFEAQGIDIERIHLKSVEYARLTQQEYSDEVTGLRVAPQLIWSQDASIERLKLALDVSTVENVKMNYFKRKDGEVAKFVQQQNRYTWIFESQVTRPEDVDWRIAGIYRMSGRVLDLLPEDRATKA